MKARSNKLSEDELSTVKALLGVSDSRTSSKQKQCIARLLARNQKLEYDLMNYELKEFVSHDQLE